MKSKAALVLSLLVFSSLISFSNRCGKRCDGRVVTTTSVTAAAAAEVIEARAAEDKEALEREHAGLSPFLRMAITL